MMRNPHWRRRYAIQRGRSFWVVVDYYTDMLTWDVFETRASAQEWLENSESVDDPGAWRKPAREWVY